MGTKISEKRDSYTTLDEILDDLLKTLDTRTIEKIRTISDEELNKFSAIQHMGLGLYIRNKYFHGNPDMVKLTENLGVKSYFNPIAGDTVGGIILRKLYEKIRGKK